MVKVCVMCDVWKYGESMVKVCVMCDVWKYGESMVKVFVMCDVWTYGESMCDVWKYGEHVTHASFITWGADTFKSHTPLHTNCTQTAHKLHTNCTQTERCTQRFALLWCTADHLLQCVQQIICFNALLWCTAEHWLQCVNLGNSMRTHSMTTRRFNDTRGFNA